MLSGPVLFAIFLLAFVVIGVALYFALRAPRGIKGTPVPDTVDCANGFVTGHMNPNTSEQPTKFYAYIFDDETAAAPAAPDPGWVATHKFVPGTSVNFELSGVSGDAGASGMVLVVIWAEFADGSRTKGQAVLPCGSGSGGTTTSPGGGGGNLMAPLFRIAPQQYQLTTGQLLGTDPAWLRELGTRPITLDHVREQRAVGAVCWRARSPSGVECQLVVTACCGGQPSGELTLHVPANGRPAQQITYRTDYWNFTGHNRVSLAQPGTDDDLSRTMTIAPA